MQLKKITSFVCLLPMCSCRPLAYSVHVLLLVVMHGCSNAGTPGQWVSQMFFPCVKLPRDVFTHVQGD